jgi:signal transduction histidine kinase/ActR/RegA family two-component response regulator
MPWIVPAMVATLTNSVVLAFVYLYLAWIERNRPLLLFCLGWTLYAFRFIGMIGYVHSGSTNTFWLAVDETAAASSAVVLLLAMLRFTGSSVPRWLWAVVVVSLVWIGVMNYLHPPLWVSSWPVYWLIGGCLSYIGVRFWSTRSLPVREARFVGVTFILWGLHKIDYPLLRPIEWFAPWGYLIGALLGLLSALGIVLVYLRMAREQVNRNRADYLTLVESSPYPVYVRKGDQLLYTNHRMLKLLGLDTYHDITGTLLQEHIEVLEQTDLPASINVSLHSSIGPHYVERELKVVLPHKAGQQAILHTMGLDVDFEDESARLVFCEDVTDKLRFEQQLRRSERLQALGTLAGGIAHDFNNILFAIQGYTEMTRGELPRSSPVQTYMEEVLGACQRAADLIKQILSFARREERKTQPLKIAPVIKEALRLLRASLPTTVAFAIDMDTSALEATVTADPTGIHQIVMNMCTNASHAMPGGGELTVNLTLADVSEQQALRNPDLEPGNYVLLQVGDTGTGIAPNHLDHIFEPFFTTKAQGEGTGMGLSVVHGIVAGYGGAITVQTELGRGTTFNIYFPLVGGAAESRAHANVRTTLMGRGRVLIVDDEPVILDLLKQMLTSLGYEPVARMDGQEALEVISADPSGFSAVVTDQTMPKLTGLELARAMAEFAPDVPVIILTGYNASLLAEGWKGTSVKLVLHKPVLLQDLAAALHSVCRVPTPVVQA